MVDLTELLNIEVVSKSEELKNNFIDILNKFGSLDGNKLISWDELKDLFIQSNLNIDCINYDETLFFTKQFIFVYRNFAFDFPYGNIVGIIKYLSELKTEVDSYWDDNNLCLDRLFIKMVKPYIISFINIYYNYLNEDKLEAIRNIYPNLEYGFRYISKEIISEIFSLSPESKEFLKQYVDEDGYLVIYRGQGSKSSSIEEAYSWSLSKEVAVWFANRFDLDSNLKSVYKAKIHIDCVKDFYNSKEQEVIAHFDDLIDVEKIKF